MSTSRTCHERGSIAATVIKPSGGKAARLDTNRTACFALQNVVGVRGEMSKTFMAATPPWAADLKRFYSAMRSINQSRTAERDKSAHSTLRSYRASAAPALAKGAIPSKVASAKRIFQRG